MLPLLPLRRDVMLRLSTLKGEKGGPSKGYLHCVSATLRSCVYFPPSLFFLSIHSSHSNIQSLALPEYVCDFVSLPPHRDVMLQLSTLKGEREALQGERDAALKKVGGGGGGCGSLWLRRSGCWWWWWPMVVVAVVGLWWRRSG